jgi:hypothetical protein
VRCETDARLIRLTEESLDQVARRRPRIARRLFANLSQVLAERLASVTARVH